MSAVLLVDDDPDIRAIARLALRAAGGFSVVEAASAAEALEAAQRGHVDVVLLDAMMPGGSGPSVAGALRERTGAPVVFLTARTEPEDVEEYRRVGAAGVIPKPFHPAALAAEVRRLAGLPARPG